MSGLRAGVVQDRCAAVAARTGTTGRINLTRSQYDARNDAHLNTLELAEAVFIRRSRMFRNSVGGGVADRRAGAAAEA